jgi:hypothetical protein
MQKVRVYKNGVEVGWYKDIVPGANAVIATCKLRGMDICDYEFRDFDDDKKVVWRGIDANLDV